MPIDNIFLLYYLLLNVERILTEEEIRGLIDETKILPDKWSSLFQLKSRSNYMHEERNLLITGKTGNKFRIILRQNKINIFDFSIILIFVDRNGKEFRLIRYNGKHPSVHTNKWEKREGYSNFEFNPTFHIHKATQRYQEAGFIIDGYAEPTAIYYDFKSALGHFLSENNFRELQGPQRRLFE